MDTRPTSPRAEFDLMTEQDPARHLKVCRRQLYNGSMAGLIPCFKLGNAVRFRSKRGLKRHRVSLRCIA